jgi:hypothetical protein
MHKTLVLYVFHIFNDRVKYFIDNAIFKHPYVDFVIISNGYKDEKLREIVPEYVKIIFRENLGYDFGGWARGLFDTTSITEYSNNCQEKYLYEKYKYFIFVNSSVIGPFIPIYCKKKWTDIFIEQLNLQNINNNVKLIGCTINSSGSQVGVYIKPELGSHLQSYLFCLERNTLDFLIKEKIFENEFNIDGTINEEIMYKYKNMTFTDAIINKEILISRKIIENGWNIGSILKMYIDVDFTFKNKSREEYEKNGVQFHGDIMYNYHFNKLWNLYDLIFYKGNRDIH